MSPATLNIASTRRPGIDLARGLAVLAMVAYHFTWDLGYFHIVDGYPAASAPGRLAAHTIAMSFLAIVGISLVLASRSPTFVQKFWRRQLILGVSAAAISAATYYFIPESWIFFGILHCIFVCSLIGFVLVAAPVERLAWLAVFSVLLPIFVANLLFDQPALVWLGLGTELPFTNDFAPLFPSLAAVLAGMVFARFKFPHLPFANDNTPGTKPGLLTRAVSFCGRHALPIYLIHQPLLFGAFLGLTTLANGSEARFEADCQMQCNASGGTQQICKPSCSCVTAEMKSAKLWDALVKGNLDIEGRNRMSDFAVFCGNIAKASTAPQN